MMADHNNFMSFDINDEKDALTKLENFARYVVQPLNPVLQERKLRMDIMHEISESSDDLRRESEDILYTSQNGSQMEGASASSSRHHSGSGAHISSL